MSSGTTDGIGKAARFNQIYNMIYDGSTYIYLADHGNACVRRLEIATQNVTTYAGVCGTTGYTTGVNRLSALYKSVTGLRIYSGMMYIADSTGNALRKIDMSTDMDSVFAGSTTGAAGTADGIGTAARFSNPSSIDFDDVGNLFVTDSSNSAIRWVNVTTGDVKRIGSSGTIASNLDGINGQMSQPTRVIYYNNALYVVGLYSSTLRKIVYDKTNPQGTDNTNYPVFSTVAGANGDPGEVNGVAGTSRLLSPHGLALNGSSFLISSRYNNTIYSFDPATNTLSNFYHFHHQVRSEFSALSTTKFYGPYGITTDGTYVYVGSDQGHVIQKIDLSLNRTTLFAGLPMQGGRNDGNVSTAKLTTPLGLASVGSGIYMADTYDHTIRYVKNGVVTTIAGNPGMSGTTDSTSGTVSLFNGPYQLCANGNDLFISEVSNNRIRKLSFVDINNPTVNPTVTTLKDGANAVITISTPGQIYCKNTGTVGTQGLYVVERNSSVRKISKLDFAGGTSKVVIAGSGGTGTADNAIGTLATMTAPLGLTGIGEKLYFTDSGAIRQIDLSDSNFPVTTIVGSVGVTGILSGDLKTSRFNNLRFLAAIGNTLYVPDYTNNCVRIIDLTNNKVTSIGSFFYDPLTTYGVTNGNNYPTDYPELFNSIGKVGDYIYTNSKGRLLKINYKTRVSEVIAGELYDYRKIDGNFSTARLGNISGGLVDAGIIYSTDIYAHVIRKINIANQTITAFAGTADSAGNTSSNLNYPTNALIKGSELLVVSSNIGTDIRRINLASGIISTLTGQYTVGGTADGNSTQTQFIGPTSMSLIGNDLFVGDKHGNTIRKIDVSDMNNPISTTVAGSGVGTAIDGTGTSATFNSPNISVTNDGIDLMIADNLGSTIRRFNPTSTEVKTVIGVDEECNRIDGLLSVARTCNPQRVITTDDGLFFTDESGYAIRWIH